MRGRRYLVDFLGSSYPSHLISGVLGIFAVGIIWSMLPHKAVTPGALPHGAPPPHIDASVVAQEIASSHIFGQDAAAESAIAAHPATDIKVDGIIYSDDKDSALAILDIDGKSDIFRVGDTLPDGEKILALAPTAVQLGSPGNPRVIEMQAQFGDSGSGIDSGILAAAGPGMTGSGNPFPGMAPALPRPALRPVELAQDADPLSQLRSLRQQLIRQEPSTPPSHPAKRPPSH